MILLEKSICELFLYKDKISNLINPYDIDSTTKLFKDLFIIINFFKIFFTELHVKKFSEMKVDIQFDSEDENDTLSEKKIEFLKKEVDFKKIIEILDNFEFYQVNNGHNARLNASSIEICLEKLDYN